MRNRCEKPALSDCLLPILLPILLTAAPLITAGVFHAAGSGLLTGIDVLKRDDLRQLHDLKIGLITNQTGIDRAGNSDIQLLHAAANVKLVTIFSNHRSGP